MTTQLDWINTICLGEWASPFCLKAYRSTTETPKTKAEQTTSLMEQCPMDIWDHIWQKPNAALSQKHFIPTVKHGDGGVMISGCFYRHGTQVPHSHWVDHEHLCTSVFKSNDSQLVDRDPKVGRGPVFRVSWAFTCPKKKKSKWLKGDFSLSGITICCSFWFIIKCIFRNAILWYSVLCWV